MAGVIGRTVGPFAEAGLIDDVRRRRRGVGRRHRRARRRGGRARARAGRAAARVRAGARQGRRDVARARRDRSRDRVLPRRRHRRPRSAPSPGPPRAAAAATARRTREGRVRPPPANRGRRAPPRGRAGHRADGPPAAQPPRAAARRIHAAAGRRVRRPPRAARAIPFPVGYGVEIAVLIDALRAVRARSHSPSARSACATTATRRCARSARWPTPCSPPLSAGSSGGRAPSAVISSGRGMTGTR